MKQPLTVGFAVVVLITVAFLAFIAGRFTGQNALDFRGISGKSLLYLSNDGAVNSLTFGVDLNGQVTQKEADALLIKRGDGSGVWVTMKESTVFYEVPREAEGDSKNIEFKDIGIGDSVMIMGKVEAKTVVADVVFREARQ